MEFRLGVNLNGLHSEDLLVECLVGRTDDHGQFTMHARHVLNHAGTEGNDAVYLGSVALEQSGLVSYKLRAYPHHALLCRRFEMGLMKWV